MVPTTLIGVCCVSEWCFDHFVSCALICGSRESLGLTPYQPTSYTDLQQTVQTSQASMLKKQFLHPLSTWYMATINVKKIIFQLERIEIKIQIPGQELSQLSQDKVVQFAKNTVACLWLGFDTQNRPQELHTPFEWY